MVKKIILIFPLLLSICGCGQKLYKIERDRYGEPILNDKAKYSFTEIPTLEDLKKIDTTAYYIQVFPDNLDREEIKKNPRIIIFHNDGFFKNESLLYFGKFDQHRGKNSVYYGGKYRINGNIIQLEQFGKYPGYKKWYRRISEGKMEGDKIIFKDKNSVTVFEKRKELPRLDN
ncbi:MAG: hypothetical protein ABS44_05730 [Chryseobacterium sp. SCN 40-13]|nr:MAG: hypothetical protein ABS44_05730 [Chryseobacterium sp. SCN 40-13]